MCDCIDCEQYITGASSTIYSSRMSIARRHVVITSNVDEDASSGYRSVSLCDRCRSATRRIYFAIDSNWIHWIWRVKIYYFYYYYFIFLKKWKLIVFVCLFVQIAVCDGVGWTIDASDYGSRCTVAFSEIGSTIIEQWTIRLVWFFFFLSSSFIIDSFIRIL